MIDGKEGKIPNVISKKHTSSSITSVIVYDNYMENWQYIRKLKEL